MYHNKFKFLKLIKLRICENMDLIATIGIIGAIITILSIPSLIAWYTDRFPFIRKILFLLFNKPFNVKIKGVKEYPSFNYDLKLIKRKIYEKYQINKINIPKKNSMIILMKNMQAPYKILFLPNSHKSEETTKVIITLEGEVKFSYNSNQNKYLNIVDELFTLIEEEYVTKTTFKWFSLEAYTRKLEDKPLQNFFETINCEDTTIEMDKVNKYMKINSDSINNITNCLNSKIEKII